ncbi:unnamed protein product [Chondrus crispus]|uniref:Uncharacterized protein n=1 Tax=Chondrus crispus TaxID=2769 RepID=R7QFE2_CHOCR|nr:unnamed protein product [Chondrus crispus]CDF36135.1 unnamed protein product [Chondrus crispus]|eukprot:XP_005715954.1 unnamed protein product [Chondrus crispus]
MQGYASLFQKQVLQKTFSKPIDAQLLSKIRGPASAFVLQTESFHRQECLANQEAPGSSSTFYSNVMEVALAWWKEEQAGVIETQASRRTFLESIRSGFKEKINLALALWPREWCRTSK